MGYTSTGLTDKFYWRKTGGRWHCFEKTAGPGLVSLCDGHEIARVLHQAISRPDPALRCGLCGGKEASRRGWNG
jgi:hypothetical protein